MDLDEMLRVDRCRDMDELINFYKPDLDYSPDAGTGLLSPISYALQRGILLCRENPTYRPRYWAPATRGVKMVLRPTAVATRGFTMVIFTASRRPVGTTLSEVHALCPSSFKSFVSNKLTS